ncbi:MAG TPA: molybdopterin dinucleotide binding domain-containing protein, partial [Egibacteraceae bacterium]|nr:molybdopterin dinucleotide binding domain-containing protein [Egibacteraceae bacterium]
PTEGEVADPDPEAVLAEINGRHADGTPVASLTELRADGSTACGCWIYAGCMAGGVNHTARRTPWHEQGPVALEWGWAWPSNRRMLYNRASADPEGRPWSERKRYVWWDQEQGRWSGEDVPDFQATKPPSYRPAADAVGPDAIAGDDPFIMQADGKGWLFVPAGLTDGPMPTHYEPHESPFANALYGQRANPARGRYDVAVNPYQTADGTGGGDAYPFVVTTYRLTEHHTAGGMSRTLGHLAELQPEMFCEVSPTLAAARGLTHGGWATIVTSRTAIEARVLVTERMKPLRVQGRTVEQVGLPYHWGSNGLVTGDSANDLFPIVVDPNVKIQEVKAATCDVLPGRRPRGPLLRQLVERWPAEHVALRRDGWRPERGEVGV